MHLDRVKYHTHVKPLFEELSQSTVKTLNLQNISEFDTFTLEDIDHLVADIKQSTLLEIDLRNTQLSYENLAILQTKLNKERIMVKILNDWKMGIPDYPPDLFYYYRRFFMRDSKDSNTLHCLQRERFICRNQSHERLMSAESFTPELLQFMFFKVRDVRDFILPYELFKYAVACGWEIPNNVTEELIDTFWWLARTVIWDEPLCVKFDALVDDVLEQKIVSHFIQERESSLRDFTGIKKRALLTLGENTSERMAEHERRLRHLENSAQEQAKKLDATQTQIDILTEKVKHITEYLKEKAVHGVIFSAARAGLVFVGHALVGVIEHLYDFHHIIQLVKNINHLITDKFMECVKASKESIIHDSSETAMVKLGKTQKEAENLSDWREWNEMKRVLSTIAATHNQNDSQRQRQKNQSKSPVEVTAQEEKSAQEHIRTLIKNASKPSSINHPHTLFHTSDEKKSGPQRTKADGDCAFHASLGTWNNKSRMYECKEIKAHRGKAANAIRNCQPGDPIFKSVEQAVQAMVMGGLTRGPHIQGIARNYKAHLAQNNKLEKDAWDLFEAELKEERNRDVLNHIHNQNPPCTDSLKNQFQACLPKENGLLSAMILSLPELQAAYDAYNTTTSQPNHII